MNVTRRSVVLSVLLGMAWTVLPAEEEAAKKTQLKLPKRPVSYVVKRVSKSIRQESETNTTSEVTYEISLGEAKDNGDLVLNVAYASLKANSDSQRRPYTFDSSKSDDDGELAAGVREATAKPIEVTISGGDIVRIKGFPRFEETDDRDARFRQFAIARIAGDDTLRRDLELILAFAIQGKALEQGKSYRIKRDEVERLSGDAAGGRRRFRGFRSDVIFKFDGAQKNRATFSLTTAPRERPGGGDDRRQFERKETSTGEAVVSLRNGTLNRLSLDTKSEVSSDQFSFKTDTKLTIQRQRANRKQAGEGEKKAGKEKKSDKKTEDL